MQLVVNPKIGKRLGSKMKEVMIESKSGNYKNLDNGNVEVAGIELQGDDYTMRLKTTDGMAAQTMQNGMGVVILDTEISKELELEGLARDLVRAIQNSRKDAKLDVSNRISLIIKLQQELVEVVNQFNDFIKSEVLASELVIVLPEDDMKSDYTYEDIKIGSYSIDLGISKI